MKFSIAALLIIATMAAVDARDRNNKAHKVVCYYESWAEYNKGDARVVAEDLNPTACTHVIYAFAGLKKNVMSVMDHKVDVEKKAMERVVALRKHNPNLTTMIALGGYTDGSTQYSDMARSPALRRLFVTSVVNFLKKYDFDGVDIDWEYPGYAAKGGNDRVLGRSEDKRNFIALLKELKQAFKPYGFVLSATVAGQKDKIDRAYDVSGLNKYLDFMNVMAFDYQSQGKTSYNAPLFASSDSSTDKTANAAFTVDYLIQKGAAPEKIVLGIPLYGKSYKLASTDAKLGAKAVSVSDSPTFGQLCHTLTQPGWKVQFDEKAKAAFAVKGDQWISYDCPKVIQAKLDFVVAKKLGGSFVWAVDNDDVHGSCGIGKFPAMKMFMKLLNKVDVADVPIPKA